MILLAILFIFVGVVTGIWAALNLFLGGASGTGGAAWSEIQIAWSAPVSIICFLLGYWIL